MLLAEIERRPRDLSTSDFITHKLHFADTLPHLRQVCISAHASNPGMYQYMYRFILFQAKKDGVHALRDVRRFGLESLYVSLFPDKAYSGSNLEAFAIFMEGFTFSPLLASAQGTSRRGGHGGTFYSDGAGRSVAIAAATFCQAAAPTLAYPERATGTYQHSPTRSWEGSHGGSSEAVGLPGSFPPGDCRHQSDYCNVRGVPASTSRQGSSQ